MLRDPVTLGIATAFCWTAVASALIQARGRLLSRLCAHFRTALARNLAPELNEPRKRLYICASADHHAPQELYGASLSGAVIRLGQSSETQFWLPIDLGFKTSWHSLSSTRLMYACICRGTSPASSSWYPFTQSHPGFHSTIERKPFTSTFHAIGKASCSAPWADALKLCCSLP